jgi:thiamine biosynthesis lipoprotein
MFRRPDYAEVSAVVMNTFMVMKVWGDKARPAAAKAFREIRRAESLMSAFNPSSDVSRVNREAGVRAVKVSRETCEVLNRALAVSRLSGGAFDVTAGPVTMLWKKALDSRRLPEKGDIGRALQLVGYTLLEVDTSRRLIHLKNRGSSIDLGGIAKGYAADKALSVFRRYGVSSALLDIGGNIAAFGTKPDGGPWMVGIQDPAAERGSFLGAVGVVAKAVVTSGGYEQYMEVGGRRYHHIVDPRTGMPANPGIRSATVIADTGLEADSLSTAAFVLGPRSGAELVEACGADAVFVGDSGKIGLTAGIACAFAKEPGTLINTVP